MTDTKNDARAESLDSSARLSGSNSEKLPNQSPLKSPSESAPVVGEKAAQKREYSNWLLSQLHSIIVDLRQNGEDVGLSKATDGALIYLKGIGLCRTHKMMHSGPTCPMC